MHWNFSVLHFFFYEGTVQFCDYFSESKGPNLQKGISVVWSLFGNIENTAIQIGISTLFDNEH